jgi:hypothetical protein
LVNHQRRLLYNNQKRLSSNFFRFSEKILH